MKHTDLYEFTMLNGLVKSGDADKQSTFEAFARRLPQGRRFGLVVGQGRFHQAMSAMLDEIPEVVPVLRDLGHINHEAVSWLYELAYRGWSLNVSAYREGSLYWPGSPVVQVTGPIGEALLLETELLSILNHDSAVASAAARIRLATKESQTLIEMGSRRVHEEAAVAAARAAYIAGFDYTSNVAAHMRYGIPLAGTAAHAWTLAHTSEREAFASQVNALGVDTTLLVDTYDTEQGIRTAVEVAGPKLGGIRIDSGDPAVETRRARDLLDALGAVSTRIIITGDMDEYTISALNSEGATVDGFGVGSRVATGSGHPSAGFVYKMVEVDHGSGPVPVAKKSSGKKSVGGKKDPVRNVLGDEVLMRQPGMEHWTRMLFQLADVGADAAQRTAQNALDSLPGEARQISDGQAWKVAE